MGLVRPAAVEYTAEAIEAVMAGKVIAVPTDTLYGFACDAWYNLHIRIICNLSRFFRFFFALISVVWLFDHVNNVEIV